LKGIILILDNVIYLSLSLSLFTKLFPYIAAFELFVWVMTVWFSARSMLHSHFSTAIAEALGTIAFAAVAC